MYNTKINLFETQLLEWYDVNGRKLPWRETKDPYRIWLSEIMLQQTQVPTVIPYYERWLEAFPELSAVARASQDEVLKLWEGMGYYSRCRNFHTAAQIVQNNHDGKIPLQEKLFRQLPGVGNYTARMVLSIVTGLARPAIDGNLRRAGYRLLGLKSETPYNHKRVVKFYTGQISADRPGDFNQALMDLGSQLCRPRETFCHRCPVVSLCRAAKTDRPLDYPARKQRKAVPQHQMVAGFIQSEEKFLVRKRNEKLLNGLWELPMVPFQADKNNDHIQQQMEALTGCDLIRESNGKSIIHRYTHFSLTVSLVHYRLADPGDCPSHVRQKWISKNDIANYAFHKATHKLFSLLNFPASQNA